jgi:hypothetical protein
MTAAKGHDHRSVGGLEIRLARSHTAESDKRVTERVWTRCTSILPHGDGGEDNDLSDAGTWPDDAYRFVGGGCRLRFGGVMSGQSVALLGVEHGVTPTLGRSR